MNNDAERQREAAQSEIKVKTITNGWILKTRTGWAAYSDLGIMLEAIRREATQLAAQVRVDEKRARRVAEMRLVDDLNKTEGK